MAGHPKLDGIEIESSYILGVIYDDDSLTLEMDFHLIEGHPAYQAPGEAEQACYRQGFIRFAEIDDLRLRKAKPEDGKVVDYSDVYSATFDGDYVNIASGWGEIELTAQSIQIALD